VPLLAVVLVAQAVESRSRRSGTTLSTPIRSLRRRANALRSGARARHYASAELCTLACGRKDGAWDRAEGSLLTRV